MGLPRAFLDCVAVGTPIKDAMVNISRRVTAEQKRWEVIQTGTAQTVKSIMGSIGDEVLDWLCIAIEGGRLRSTEAGRMELLGRGAMPDGMAFNLLDLCLRMFLQRAGISTVPRAEGDWRLRPAKEGGDAAGQKRFGSENINIAPPPFWHSVDFELLPEGSLPPKK
jgi:hypothetical protein